MCGNADLIVNIKLTKQNTIVIQDGQDDPQGEQEHQFLTSLFPFLPFILSKMRNNKTKTLTFVYRSKE